MVLAEELLVLDGDSPLWPPVRPLLDALLRLEQNDDTYSWHGWNKQQILTFLDQLPSQCSLIVGVWKTIPGEDDVPEREDLVLGVVCEVVDGQVRSLRTFQALTAAGLKPIKQLEPGLDDAVEIMRISRILIAPVAWALFIEKSAWDEWLLGSENSDVVVDKGELLVTFERKGRCVLMRGQQDTFRDELSRLDD
jgi:hypothetical protein